MASVAKNLFLCDTASTPLGVSKSKLNLQNLSALLMLQLFSCIHIETYPKEGVQWSVLHEFSDDHYWSTLGHHSLQVDDVGMVELPHDAGFAQEVPPLLLSVAWFQSLDGHQNLPLSRKPEITTTYLSKLT